MQVVVFWYIPPHGGWGLLRRQVSGGEKLVAKLLGRKKEVRKMEILNGSIAVAACALFTGTASADLFMQETPYLSGVDSPFAGHAGWQVEDFEDGFLNIPGLSASAGRVRGPGDNRDSVDGDDGFIDGWGTSGSSYIVNSTEARVDFSFDIGELGDLPTEAGLVFTDGIPGGTFIFKAWDADNNLIGIMELTLGDDARDGGTAEDRFIGVTSDLGISRIRLRSMEGGFELDHVQFGYGAIPAPGALALLGMAGLASRRRRRG